MAISHLANKSLKNVRQSAISDHLFTCDYNIKFNGFTILSEDSNNINLLIKESLVISRDKPILNQGIVETTCRPILFHPVLNLSQHRF